MEEDHRGAGEREAQISEFLQRLSDLQEHKDLPVPKEIREELEKYFDYEEPGYDDIQEIKNLGLFLKYEGKDLYLNAYYFIGVWPLKDKEGKPLPNTYIIVRPKEKEGRSAHPIYMLQEIMEDSEIVSHEEFQNTFRMGDSERLIPLETEDQTFVLFIIVRFLKTLERLVRKGLKKGYVTYEESLNGRAKGKINLKETYQRHISRGIYTRNYCRFQVFTEDFLENRLLKTALFLAGRYVKNYDFPFLNHLIAYLGAIFEKVSLMRAVSELDFLKVKHSPFFPDYREALELARLIFKHLGCDPFGEIREVKEVPPYIINMPKLFELYVWKRLRKEYSDSEIHYQHQETEGDRPDFLIKGKGLIIDAKYKYLYEEDKISPEDIGQLARYGRNEYIRKKVSKSDCVDEEPKLVIAYPTFKEKVETKEKLGPYWRVYKKPFRILEID